MEVQLNVYDLPGQTATNDGLYSIGSGFYHSGVSVRDLAGLTYEYSFSQMGVSKTPPLLPDFGIQRQQIRIGVYHGSASDFVTLLNELRTTAFPEGTYDLLHLNCNHFSDAFCMALCEKHIPAWVNAAANLGSNFIPRDAASAAAAASATKASSTSSSSGGSSKGTPLFAMPGVVPPPTLNKPLSPSPVVASSSASSSSSSSATDDPVTSLFSWVASAFGGGSGGKREKETIVPVKAAEAPRSQHIVQDASPQKKKVLTEKQKAMLERLKNTDKHHF